MRQFPQDVTLAEIAQNRREDIAEYERLRDGKLRGRWRTGIRAVPADATDVVLGDIEADCLNDDTYFYRLVRISGTLKWDRQALDTGW